MKGVRLWKSTTRNSLRSGWLPPRHLSEAGFDRVLEHQVVDVVLKKADHHLHITNTAGWIAVVGGRKIDIARSYRDNALTRGVEIDWGPDHGAGGYA